MIDNSITTDAINLITGDRQQDYGDFDRNLRDIGTAWATILDRTTPIPAADVARMMASLKLNRASRKYKRDNYVDAIAYLLMAEALDTRRLQPQDKPWPTWNIDRIEKR